MQTKLLYDKDPRTVAAVFDTGDEAADGLASVAREHALQAASLTGIGGFSSVVLGYFDPDTRSYSRIPVDEQVEVLSLTGDVALGEDGRPMVHAHVVVGLVDGRTRGGHLLEGWVRPTLEVVFLESPGHLQRRTDPKTGLPAAAAVMRPHAQVCPRGAQVRRVTRSRRHPTRPRTRARPDADGRCAGS